MNYDFLSPTRIVFGWGRRSELGGLAQGLGSRVLLLSGSRTLERSGHIDKIANEILGRGLEVHQFSAASHEPEVADVDVLVQKILPLQPADRGLIVAIGGGSTIDLAKATAALLTNRQSPCVTDYLEGVGRGLKITERPIPVIAMPTTAGTGTEVTKNAVISSFQPAFKKSLRSDLMIPKIVLIDPELTASVPPQTTAYTGMDAITQLIESYISCRAAPIPRALALSGLKLAVPALANVVRDGSSRSDRESMSHAALLSGLALANSGLGMAHGVAASLGVHCRISHGLACAVMLPTTLRTNRQVCERDYADLEQLFDHSDSMLSKLADAFVVRIERLCQQIGIPSRLRDIGVKEELLPAIVAGSRGNSMSGNPREICDPELLDILREM